MASQEISLNNGQQAIIHTNTKKVFLWNYRTQEGQINNAAYADLVVPEGTVMGRVSATGLLKPFTSGASDGSQFPIGVMLGGVTVEYGDTLNVAIGDDGDVNAGALIFDGTDDLDTVVSSRQVRDWLKMAGIKAINSTELTAEDND